VSPAERIVDLRIRAAADRRELGQALSILKEPLRAAQIGLDAAREVGQPPMVLRSGVELLAWVGLPRVARIARWGWIAAVVAAALSRFRAGR
jgi:hypothetical protein